MGIGYMAAFVLAEVGVNIGYIVVVVLVAGPIGSHRRFWGAGIVVVVAAAAALALEPSCML